MAASAVMFLTSAEREILAKATAPSFPVRTMHRVFG